MYYRQELTIILLEKLKGIKISLPIMFLVFLLLNSCTLPTVDKGKRELLVKKYDLVNFPNLGHSVLVTVDEFFEGNNDEASIAPNLERKPKMHEYYEVLKELSLNPKVVDVLVKINEVMIYEGGKLDDNEWFYTDIVYVVGDLTKEDIKEATKSLRPDEVEYNSENQLQVLDDRYRNKKVVYVWWD